jgi:hypothetical protein
MTVGSSRALVRTKNEIKKLPWNIHKQDMSEYERRFCQLHGMTHDSEGKPREDEIKGLVEKFDMYP